MRLQRLIMVLLFVSASGAQDRAPALEEFAWLAGCWEGRMGPVTFEEQWNKPAGGVMLGVGRAVKDGRAVSLEFLKLERSGDSVVYTAIAGKQAPTPFRFLKGSATDVVFENKEHDFPQRVIYRKQGADGVFARIEGVDKTGRARGEDFPMKRARCEP